MSVKIYATHDKSGYVNYTAGVGNWDTIHDAASGKQAVFAQESGDNAVRAYNNGSQAHISRAFFQFAVPEDAPSNISSLTLNIKDDNASGTAPSDNQLDIIVVEGTQTVPHGTGNNLLIYNDFTGHTSGWNNTNVTAYSDEVSYSTTTWSTSDYNTITLNANARSAFTPNSDFKVVIMSYHFDYLDSVPTSGYDESIDMRLQGSGTSNDPYIEYEEAAAPRDITGPLKIQAGGKIKISAGKLTIKT